MKIRYTTEIELEQEGDDLTSEIIEEAIVTMYEEATVPLLSVSDPDLGEADFLITVMESYTEVVE